MGGAIKIALLLVPSNFQTVTPHPDLAKFHEMAPATATLLLS